MNQRQKPKKKRGATAAAVLCFVAAIAIVGTYTFRDYREAQQEEKLAKAEDAEKLTEEKEDDEEDSEETSTDARNIVINTKDKTDTETEEAKDTQAQEPEEDAEDTGGYYGVQTTAAQAAYFDSDSKLLWPVNGAVILGYSMDKTVYFQTLDQYKYNPALIISGAEGDQVICGAPGIVKSIDVTAETGTTVNIDIGNGYELFYGQLKEVPVMVGDSVEAKTVIGYVSKPTKYYSVEGCNVYFEMRKDGQPIDPVEYLE